MRSVKLAIAKTYNNKKNHIKGITTKHVFSTICFKIFLCCIYFHYNKKNWVFHYLEKITNIPKEK